MKFNGIQKTSLIDYPDKISTILFTPGCNLRCPYCHNWRIILEPIGPFITDEEVLQILENRKRFVDSIVITGGEPTIHEGLPNFSRILKENNYLVKIDSNGLLPEMLEKCIPYTDYFAIDVKTAPELYKKLKADNTEGLMKTIKILKSGSVEYEFRCTVVPGFVDENIVTKMGMIVKGAKRFVFQQFIPGDTLDPFYNTVTPYTKEKIEKLADIMESYVKEVILRI